MRSFLERRGVVVSFMWGLSEATLFFLVPDIPVGAVALYSHRRGGRAVVAAVAGAVVGGVALWIVTRGVGAWVRDVLTALPGIPERFFSSARDGIADRGGVAVVLGPSGGVPYKVYVAEWALAGRSVVTLALWTVPARALRIGAVALVSAGAGVMWRRLFGDRRGGILLGLYGGVWLAVYASYFAAVGR